MFLNSDSLVSMREANQNFSKVARLVEDKGSVVVLKNNKPHLVILRYEGIDEDSNLEKLLANSLFKQIAQEFVNRYEYQTEQVKEQVND